MDIIQGKHETDDQHMNKNNSNSDDDDYYKTRNDTIHDDAEDTTTYYCNDDNGEEEREDNRRIDRMYTDSWRGLIPPWAGEIAADIQDSFVKVMGLPDEDEFIMQNGNKTKEKEEEPEGNMLQEGLVIPSDLAVFRLGKALHATTQKGLNFLQSHVAPEPQTRNVETTTGWQQNEDVQDTVMMVDDVNPMNGALDAFADMALGAFESIFNTQVNIDEADGAGNDNCCASGERGGDDITEMMSSNKEGKMNKPNDTIDSRSEKDVNLLCDLFSSRDDLAKSDENEHFVTNSPGNTSSGNKTFGGVVNQDTWKLENSETLNQSEIDFSNSKCTKVEHVENPTIDDSYTEEGGDQFVPFKDSYELENFQDHFVSCKGAEYLKKLESMASISLLKCNKYKSTLTGKEKSIYNKRIKRIQIILDLDEEYDDTDDVGHQDFLEQRKSISDAILKVIECSKFKFRSHLDKAFDVERSRNRNLNIDTRHSIQQAKNLGRHYLAYTVSLAVSAFISTILRMNDTKNTLANIQGTEERAFFVRKLAENLKNIIDTLTSDMANAINETQIQKENVGFMKDVCEDIVEAFYKESGIGLGHIQDASIMLLYPLVESEIQIL